LNPWFRSSRRRHDLRRHSGATPQEWNPESIFSRVSKPIKKGYSPHPQLALGAIGYADVQSDRRCAASGMTA
jgi:hypothetical protein